MTCLLRLQTPNHFSIIVVQNDCYVVIIIPPFFCYILAQNEPSGWRKLLVYIGTFFENIRLFSRTSWKTCPSWTTSLRSPRIMCVSLTSYKIQAPWTIHHQTCWCFTEWNTFFFDNIKNMVIRKNFRPSKGREFWTPAVQLERKWWIKKLKIWHADVALLVPR